MAADRLDANAFKSDLHSFGSELWSMIGSHALWGAVPQEQRIKRFQNIVSSHPGAYSSQGDSRQDGYLAPVGSILSLSPHTGSDDRA